MGGLLFTIHLKFSPLFISINFGLFNKIRPIIGSRTSPPPPPHGHLPPFEKWHVWTSATQAIDRGG